MNPDSKAYYKHEEAKLQAESRLDVEDRIPESQFDTDNHPRSTTLDLPHLSSAIITGEGPFVLPSLKSVVDPPHPGKQAQSPAPAIARRFANASNSKNPS
jgi:hypothetical protein